MDQRSIISPRQFPGSRGCCSANPSPMSTGSPTLPFDSQRPRSASQPSGINDTLLKILYQERTGQVQLDAASRGIIQPAQWLGFLDPAASAHTEFPAELECRADRLSSGGPLRRQGRRAQPGRDALGSRAILGQGHQSRLREPVGGVRLRATVQSSCFRFRSVRPSRNGSYRGSH